MGNKKIIKNQQYENYWKLTLEYSDFYGKQFNTVLAIIVDYIDKFSTENGLTSKDYRQLQDKIGKLYHKKDGASTRKSINQMFKLGFINNKARNYHYLTKEFLKEEDIEKKRALYSKIVYDNSAFSRSFTDESNVNQIKFLVNTLEECGEITKEELLGILYCDINKFPKGYLTKNELALKLAEITVNEAEKRKYNQRNYLFNLCGNLTGIYVKDNIMSLNHNLIDDDEKIRVGRDPYLQRLYKLELIEEEKKIYHDVKGKCVLEHKAYPVLIA